MENQKKFFKNIFCKPIDKKRKVWYNHAVVKATMGV